MSAPAFSLPSGRNGPVALSSYRGRRNLVLFFATRWEREQDRAALRAFARRYGDYQADQTEVLAVLPASQAAVAGLQAELELPFPLLADAEEKVRASYAALLPTQPDSALVFVLDRYRAPYAAVVDADPADPTLHREILDWIDFIELQCPE
jgi:peroxiredoxin